MADECFVLKENSEAIREKIRDAGIRVCVCASFNGTIWLDYSTVVSNGVHGLGYGDETMSGEAYLSLFMRETKNVIVCKDVDEFIARILEFESQDAK